jgi:hypothetical protein
MPTRSAVNSRRMCDVRQDAAELDELADDFDGAAGALAGDDPDEDPESGDELDEDPESEDELDEDPESEDEPDEDPSEDEPASDAEDEPARLSVR